MQRGKILILLATGFDETDVSTTTRILRQAGLPVQVVGLTGGQIRGASGLSLAPDVTLSEVETRGARAVLLPGGMQGARLLNAEPRVHDLLHCVANQGGYVVALDEAYVVLRSAGLLEGRLAAVPHRGGPAYEPETSLSERVTVEGSLIVGRDGGTAQETALTLVTLLEGGRGVMRDG